MKKPLKLQPLKPVATPPLKKEVDQDSSASDIDNISVDDLKQILGKGVRDSQQSKTTSNTSKMSGSVRQSMDSEQSLLLFDANEIVDENCMVAQIVKSNV